MKLDKFLKQPNFLIKKEFSIGWYSLWKPTEPDYNLDHQKFIFVLMSGSIDNCKPNDCLVLFMSKKEEKWRVEFTAPTSGVIFDLHYDFSLGDNRRVGPATVVKSSHGYLFYQLVKDKFELVYIKPL